ncbi:Protein of unknown function [Pyronema omphalodes CBS 100304]|uniref:Uncharacterized protein n=1 Tax=Pyronema omphalodes (strain CBS 100304) TaxID=1076935 RepID=U4LNN7_PYROM|nr:Protein of unknown function [Pyronema omphalodes CBS 100304]
MSGEGASVSMGEPL